MSASGIPWSALVIGSGRNSIDIALFADVLRRHRVVVLVGVLLTVALAVLSYVRVSPSGVGYRSEEVWSNQATLVLTSQGAPELRSVLPTAPGGYSPALADTGRFASLIDVYATLATSDAVLGRLVQRGLIDEDELKVRPLPVVAAPAQSTVNASTPMMTLTATASTGPKATARTLAATKAFLNVLHASQAKAKIPVKDRIQVRVVKGPEAAQLVASRSKALTMLVLLAGLIATAAVAVTRDNLARRERAPHLRAAESLDEPAGADLSLGVAREPDSSLGVTRGRWAPRERDMPDKVAQ